ncbi:MAG: hypothetical protein E6J89_19565 [Deltaproteobacteria bacterium]|nr:MAG: hypothetical protein E6J89_19565 [Deltaproteobacteria bacterium]
MTELEQLKKAIWDLHGCESKYSRSVAVHETFEGQTVWQGAVEVFDLLNHPLAKIAYAWVYKTDSGESRHVAVLGVPPINSPQDAIRAYVVAKARRSP